MYTVFSCTSCLVPVRAAALLKPWLLCATAVAPPLSAGKPCTNRFLLRLTVLVLAPFEVVLSSELRCHMRMTLRGVASNAQLQIIAFLEYLCFLWGVCWCHKWSPLNKGIYSFVKLFLTVTNIFLVVTSFSLCDFLRTGFPPFFFLHCLSHTNAAIFGSSSGTWNHGTGFHWWPGLVEVFVAVPVRYLFFQVPQCQSNGLTGP